MRGISPQHFLYTLPDVDLDCRRQPSSLVEQVLFRHRGERFVDAKFGVSSRDVCFRNGWYQIRKEQLFEIAQSTRGLHARYFRIKRRSVERTSIHYARSGRVSEKKLRRRGCTARSQVLHGAT